MNKEKITINSKQIKALENFQNRQLSNLLCGKVRVEI